MNRFGPADGGGAPCVSIVIPIHNRAACVAQIVETLQAQTLTDWEAIFVDDGSTCDMVAVLAPHLSDRRLRLLRLPENRGVSSARNAGMDAASGRYVAFLDSDDTWAPAKLARQVACLDTATDPARSACITLTNVLMPGGWTRLRPDAPLRDGQDFAEFLYVDGGFAQISSLMVPRSIASAVRFREPLRQYEDHLFFIEIAATGAAFLLVPEALTTWTNDDRPDRLSSVDDIARGELLLAIAGPLFTRRATIGFRLRVLGKATFRRHPARALGHACVAMATGAMPIRTVLPLIARWIIPANIWSQLRQRFAP
jgi:glycosyltransferase involved in cell wall biosynthesis